MCAVGEGQVSTCQRFANLMAIGKHTLTERFRQLLEPIESWLVWPEFDGAKSVSWIVKMDGSSH